MTKTSSRVKIRFKAAQMGCFKLLNKNGVNTASFMISCKQNIRVSPRNIDIHQRPDRGTFVADENNMVFTWLCIKLQLAVWKEKSFLSSSFILFFIHPELWRKTLAIMVLYFVMLFVFRF